MTSKMQTPSGFGILRSYSYHHITAAYSDQKYVTVKTLCGTTKPRSYLVFNGGQDDHIRLVREHHAPFASMEALVAHLKESGTTIDTRNWPPCSKCVSKARLLMSGKGKI